MQDLQKQLGETGLTLEVKKEAAGPEVKRRKVSEQHDPMAMALPVEPVRDSQVPEDSQETQPGHVCSAAESSALEVRALKKDEGIVREAKKARREKEPEPNAPRLAG